MNTKFWKIVVLAVSLIGLTGCDEDIFVAQPTSDTTTTTTTTTTTPTTTTTTPTTTTTTTPPPTPTGTPGSISFISADPTNISIKGSGGTETTTVTFRVLDTGGAPLANETVNFALNTTTGGITFSPATAISDANGDVKTAVTAGTVATSVTVTATLASNTTITGASSGIIISTGLADQNSFSISADKFNPEAWGRDGETVAITIRAADHANNPVPDGSIVFFTAEGGSIQSNCSMSGGACSVTWTSQDPRPMDGRVAIWATMTGEESFSDNVVSNGVLDDSESYTDLPEAFYDFNENGVFEPSVPLQDANGNTYFEEFKDFNGDGVYNGPDGTYNGILCNPANVVNLCGSVKSLDVRTRLVLAMSGSIGYAFFSPTALDLTSTASGTADMAVADENGNALPAGTTIKLTANTSDLQILSSTDFTVPDNSTYPQVLSVTVAKTVTSDPLTPKTGAINVEVTTPKGTVSTNGFLTVNY